MVVIHPLTDRGKTVNDVFVLSDSRMKRIGPFCPLAHEIPRLHDMLHSELDEKRQEAAEVIRSLIERHFPSPSDG